ncbi:MAG: hypothetical protein OYH77_00300 [Pseudomonadota bacterium]|nr:hypothetical protein [Pseudomonadota bacterium]
MNAGKPQKLTLTVPAKTMLAGEYDILTSGGEAIALALNTYLRVIITLGPQANEQQITVLSDYWGEGRIITPASTDDDLLTILIKDFILPLRKVTAVEISSQYLPSYGFGSSSALILALQTAGICISNSSAQQNYGRDSLTDVDATKLLQQARSTQLRFQSQASGYDLTTQWHGGLLKLQAEPTGQLNTQALPVPQDLDEILHIYVGGKGASTPETMVTTCDWLTANDLHAMIRKHSRRLCACFIDICKQQDTTLSALIAAVAAWRQVFAFSPCFPTHIATQLAHLHGCDQTWTFKTSGAGGEDALLLIGQRQAVQVADQSLRANGWHAIPYQPDNKGLTVEWSSNLP